MDAVLEICTAEEGENRSSWDVGRGMARMGWERQKGVTQKPKITLEVIVSNREMILEGESRAMTPAIGSIGETMRERIRRWRCCEMYKIAGEQRWTDHN